MPSAVARDVEIWRARMTAGLVFSLKGISLGLGEMGVLKWSGMQGRTSLVYQPR